MSRISSLAANTALINQVLRTQSRIFDLQAQVSSEKVSQTYSGISTDSQRLLNLENTRDALAQFTKNNEQMETRLNIASASVEGIRETIKNFTSRLSLFGQGDTSDSIRVQDIQQEAFNSLKSIQDFLNTEVGGRFLFAGGRANTQPVNLGLTTLADFQAKYDGSTIQTPTTRDSQLAEFSVSDNAAFTTDTFDSGTKQMVYNDAADTITAAAGTFRYPDGSNLAVGATITTTGAVNGANNGTFTISAISTDASQVTLSGTPTLVDETATAARATAQIPLTFTNNSPAADTIAGKAGTFTDANGNNLTAGRKITIANTTNGKNDGTYTIASVSSDGSTATLRNINSGAVSMTFDNAADTITAAAGTFRYKDGTNIQAGDTFTTSGAVSAANNATFTVASVSPDGSVVTLANTPTLVNETSPAVTADGPTLLNHNFNTGSLSMSFNDAADTITAAAGTFRHPDGSNLRVGETFTTTGAANGANNATFTVASVSADGSVVTLANTPTLVTAVEPTTTATGDPNFTTLTDGDVIITAAKATNFLTFQRDFDGNPSRSVITGQGPLFTNAKPGSFITIAGTANNNGTYEVLSVPNSAQIIIRTENFTDESIVAASTTVSITAADGTTLNTGTTGNLTFARDNGATPPLSRLTAATTGSLASLKVGQKITISGAAAGPPTNNGVFTIAANDGTNIDITTKMLTDEGTLATPHLNVTTGTAEVTFTNNTAPTKDTITANAGRFSTLTAGMAVTISGGATSANNKVVTVASVSTDGSTITVNEELTAAAPDANAINFLAPFADGTISASSYFRGDGISQTHRVDKNRDFEYDLTAIDPAFEKAIRAMQLLMQGAFQSEGGLDQNVSRVDNAGFLLNSSQKRNVGGTPPFGTELTSNPQYPT
ncbi:MAG: hypothetical protein O3B76_11910 [Proteobacteria bacterium]|nr:hypothetical protein [Pseudomonadota bacterium]